MSKQYTVFDGGGRAVRRVTCPENKIHKFVKAGEEAREGYRPLYKPHNNSGAVRSAIIDLERKQLRCMRELLMDPDNTAARERLKTIDQEIAKFRAMFILLDRSPD